MYFSFVNRDELMLAYAKPSRYGIITQAYTRTERTLRSDLDDNDDKTTMIPMTTKLVVMATTTTMMMTATTMLMMTSSCMLKIPATDFI